MDIGSSGEKVLGDASLTPIRCSANKRCLESYIYYGVSYHLLWMKNKFYFRFYDDSRIHFLEQESQLSRELLSNSVDEIFFKRRVP
jgi:hypothetical protein